MKTARSLALAVVWVLVVAGIGVAAARAQRMTPVPRDARTVAQQKIDARVLSEIVRRRGDARAPVAPVTIDPREKLRIDRHGRAFVDVRAPVKPALEKKVRALGGVIVSTSGTYDSIVSWMPLLTLERLAADPTVRAIGPASR